MGCAASATAIHQRYHSGGGIVSNFDVARIILADSTLYSRSRGGGMNEQRQPPPPFPASASQLSRHGSNNNSLSDARMSEDAARVSGDYGSDAASETDKTDGLLRELDGLPSTLRRSFSNLQSFDAAELASASSRPLSLLSFAAVRDAAKAAGHGYEHLPSLLGALSRSIRKQGGQAQLLKLNEMQFLYRQLQPKGVLFRLAVSRPLLVVSLCLAALAYDVTGLEQTALRRRSSTGPVRSLPSYSTSSDGSIHHHGGDPSPITAIRAVRRMTNSYSKGQAVRNFLGGTAYVRAWPQTERVELLETVSKLCQQVTDPSMFSRLLNNEAMMMMAGPEEFLLRATLQLASFSHLFRKLRFQKAWYEQAASKLQDISVTIDGESPFCFAKAADTFSSERFVRSHSWVIRHLLVPFVGMWARVARVPEGQTLCRAIERTKRTLDDAVLLHQADLGNTSTKHSPGGEARQCDDSSFVIVPAESNVVLLDDDDDKATKTLLTSSTHQQSVCKTSNAALSMRTKSVKQKLVAVTRMMLTLKDEIQIEPCPLLGGNEAEVEIPYDSIGMLSVCKMYNINVDELLFVRRITRISTQSRYSVT